MTQNIRYRTKVHFRNGHSGRKRLHQGESPAPIEPGRIPLVSRLMALAIRFDGLLHDGAVKDQAELALLGHVSRARVTQIMNLLMLAPDIQESILFLPRTMRGRDPILDRDVRPITLTLDWRKQRRLWNDLASQTGP